MPIEKIKKTLLDCLPKTKPDIVANIVYLLINTGLVLLYGSIKEVNALVSVIVIGLISILLINYVLNYYKKDGLKIKTSFAIISVFVSVSLMIPMCDTYEVTVFKAVILGAGIILNSYLLCVVLGDLINKVEFKKHKNKLHWWDIPVFMIIPVAINGFALLGVFPGVSWFDTAYCWSMAIRTAYSDAHPILYLMLFRGLYLIWDNVAIVGIFQVLLVSFTYAYTAYRLKELGLNTKLCFLLVFIAAVIPSNLLSNIQLLKDVPYTMGLVLLSVELVRMLADKEYFKRFPNYLLLFVFTMLVMSTRHNGVFVAVAVFIALIIYFLKTSFRKNIMIIFYFLLLSIFIFTSVKNYAIDNVRRFTVDKSNSYGAFTIPVQGLMTVYANHYGEMDDVEKGVLTKYLNEDFADEYIARFEADRFWQFHAQYQNALDWEKLKTKEIDFIKTYLHYLKKYPGDMIMSYLRITGIVWSIPEYNHTTCPTTTSYYNDESDMIFPLPDVKSQTSRAWLDFWLKSTENEAGKVVFWRPALIVTMMVFILILAKRKKVLLFSMLPAFLSHGGYFFVLQAQDHRYFYAVYTIVFLAFAIKFLNINDYYSESDIFSLDVILGKEESGYLRECADKKNIRVQQLLEEYIDEGIKKDKTK